MKAPFASANMITAKLHAKYGRRLTARDYDALVNCHRVSEVASYLKNRTHYAATLKDINESTVHREHLENQLRRNMWNELAELCRYDTGIGDFSTLYLTERGEIEQILHFLQLLNAGTADTYFYSLPLFFDRHARFDLMQLSRARSYPQLLEVLRHTVYYELLLPFSAQAETRIPIAEIEAVLYRHLNQQLFQKLKTISGEQGRQLALLFGTSADARNVMYIYRLKKYFSLSPDAIRPYLLPSGGRLSRRWIERMLEADSAEEVLHLLRLSPLGVSVPPDYDPHSGQPLYYWLVGRSACRYFHLSAYPAVVMTAYFLLSSLELDDIVNLIEGIRYGMPAAKLRSFLVPVNG